MTTSGLSTWQGTILAADLAANLSELCIPGDPTALSDLLAHWEVPAVCVPSLRAAQRALQQAEMHLQAAYAIADSLTR